MEEKIIKKNKIALDLDGVIADSHSIVENEVLSMGYKMASETYKPVIFGINDSEDFIMDIVDDIFINKMDIIKPYDMIHETLMDLNSRFKIDVVTARSPKHNLSTLKWFVENFPELPFKLVNKEADEKAQFIKDNGYVYFVEDRLSTANQAAELGIKTFLIYRRWNTGRRTHQNVTRINHLQDILSYI